MGKRVRRETEVFSISFLDCITCGLGSVVLLLVLSNIRTPSIEQSEEDLREELLSLQDELIEIEGQSDILNRDLRAKQEQLSEHKQRIARLQGDLSDIRGKYQASKQEADVANQLEGRLASAQQNLTEEMKRLLGQGFRRKKDDAIGGIPVDSEYIIFIIDTSGSMFNYVWPMMIQKVEETLNVYPQVKGFQVMNDMGQYMFTGYRGKWIPDTPTQRRTVIERLRTWNVFSNSSPIEGIVEAIRTYYAKDKKISLYVLGDEFTGSSIDSVVKGVDLINREDSTGERRVRIHAIGFPVRPDAPQYTSIRFATLMRILCHRNGGTFVGLDNPERGGGPRFRVGASEQPEQSTVAISQEPS
jgi:ribosomal protein L29